MGVGECGAAGLASEPADNERQQVIVAYRLERLVGPAHGKTLRLGCEEHDYNIKTQLKLSTSNRCTAKGLNEGWRNVQLFEHIAEGLARCCGACHECRYQPHY